MSALGNFSPSAVSVVKLFAYPFRSAPTADLVAWGVHELNAGATPASLLNFLFNFPVAQSPFTAYAVSTTDNAFVTSLVGNVTFGAGISEPTKAGWIAELVPLVGQYASRGEFTLMISNLVDSYTGLDADLLALKAALAARAETAATFAQSAAGAVYDGQGFGQLLAPMQVVPEPTYDLSAGAASVNEGQAITFTLQTEHLPAGTSIAYTLAGSGITAADVVGGQLAGVLTVNANGVSTAVVTLASDGLTEGLETLRMTLANGLAQAEVSILDTSTTPATPPTYALSANVQSQDEGANIVYTLTTTQLPAGTTAAFALSGTGVTATDITGGQLSGLFTLNAQGIGTATVGLVADATTEGAEVLRLQLTGNAGQIDTTINDISQTPVSAGRPDLLLIADSMNNSQAHAPGSALEGEAPFDTYLSYDLLNQSGTADVRMPVLALKLTNLIAGAPLDLTNHSADRGNVPQVSNQDLFTFDLGLQIDRVDYSAETGKIVALLNDHAPVDTQWILVNDDGVDDVFSGATDRIDTLKNVEEIVASAGGGVLDLTQSGRDWRVTFSRNFNASTDVDTAADRAVHRIELVDLGSGLPYGRNYFDYRDAGGLASVTQATAAWTSVQGSDRNETLVFSSAESLDARLNVLRGGSNGIKFNELTRSILVDVAMTPWLASSNVADDTNATGRLSATTTFTNGDGVTPLSGNVNLTSSHMPDNGIAAGSLLITGTQDAEDALGFSGTPLPKVITLGTTINGADGASARLLSGPTTNALELTGFEFLRDNGASDDVYVIDSIFKATQAGPKLTDGVGNDHDSIQLGTEALGSAAVGGAVGTINLATLNGPAPGFGVDFDVLDLSAVITTGSLQVIGTAGSDDELVVGKLGNLAAVTLFESLVLTHASTDKGTALTLDLDAGAVKAGAATLFPYAGSVISAGGLVFNSAGQANSVTPVSTGLSITVVDTTAGPGATVWGGSGADLLTGGAGDDILRGSAGNDTLDGGVPSGTGSFTETWAFTLTGVPDAVALAANRITIAMTIDGTALTLTEAAVLDTVYGDGNGAVLDGASTATIGTAMAGLINANLAAINAGPGTGILTSAGFDAGSGTVLLSFLPGFNANDMVTFVFNGGAGPDGGTFALSAGVNVNGGNGGADRFVFEQTAALNGLDTLVNFTPASDKLDVTAFAGASISAASASINAGTGGTLAGIATTAEFIFNKSMALLSSTDFATATAAGKFVLADGARCVVAVTADPTGSRGDAANTAVSLYFVENGTVPGLSDLSVALVGTVSGPVELTLGDIFWALS